MAARENQGLQIALIIFVMLTIVLIVTTYMFFSSFTQERDKNKALAADNAKLTKSEADTKAENDEFKLALGADPKDSKETVLTRKQKDLETHGKGFTEAEQNYRYLTEFFAKELLNANVRITEITAKEKELNEKLAADETARKKEFQEYDKKLDAAKKELETERQKFNAALADVNKSKERLAAEAQKSQAAYKALAKSSTEKYSTLSTEKDRVDQLLKDIQGKELEKQKSTELADGKINWVDQRNRVVWINLGSADGLRRQTSFSVFDRDNHNPVEGSQKGKLEVTRLMDRHLAEARIVDDDLSNPLMPGDKIFSPAWEAGQPEHFGLVGFMDIDGDGVDDKPRIRQLISLNGGIIDSEIADDGNVKGSMSLQTKYLVRGDKPTEKEESKIDSYTKIIDEAQSLGIKSIDVKRFMDYLGYKPEDRSVNMGKNARSEDFKARMPENMKVRKTNPDASTSRDIRRPPKPSAD